jgi:hypothetical protein
MAKRDIDYCYLSDSTGIEFQPELYHTKGREAWVGDVCYMDPDAYSRKLYEDMKKIYLEDRYRIRKYNFRGYESYKFEYGKDSFSTDYIGPSRAWCRYTGMSDPKIGSYLDTGRRIGGHMIWPLNGTPQTVNTVRGLNVFDRIDITIAELKNVFLAKGPVFSAPLYEVLKKDLDKICEISGIEKDTAGNEAFLQFIRKWHLEPFMTKDGQDTVSLARSNYLKERKVVLSQKEPLFPGNSQGLSSKEITNILAADPVYAAVLNKAYTKYSRNLLIAIQQRNGIIDSINKA